VRDPGNCQKHLENIAGCGSNFLLCNCQIHVENIWDVTITCILYGTTGTFSSNSKLAYQCSQIISIYVPSGNIACGLHVLQSFGVYSQSLGAEGVWPGRHIVGLLRVFKQFTHLIVDVLFQPVM
jgi:hypothetical protein